MESETKDGVALWLLIFFVAAACFDVWGILSRYWEFDSLWSADYLFCLAWALVVAASGLFVIRRFILNMQELSYLRRVERERFERREPEKT